MTNTVHFPDCFAKRSEVRSNKLWCLWVHDQLRMFCRLFWVCRKYRCAYISEKCLHKGAPVPGLFSTLDAISEAPSSSVKLQTKIFRWYPKRHCTNISKSIFWLSIYFICGIAGSFFVFGVSQICWWRLMARAARGPHLFQRTLRPAEQKESARPGCNYCDTGGPVGKTGSVTSRPHVHSTWTPKAPAQCPINRKAQARSLETMLLQYFPTQLKEKIPINLALIGTENSAISATTTLSSLYVLTTPSVHGNMKI